MWSGWVVSVGMCLILDYDKSYRSALKVFLQLNLGDKLISFQMQVTELFLFYVERCTNFNILRGVFYPEDFPLSKLFNFVKNLNLLKLSEFFKISNIYCNFQNLQLSECLYLLKCSINQIFKFLKFSKFFKFHENQKFFNLPISIRLNTYTPKQTWD